MSKTLSRSKRVSVVSLKAVVYLTITHLQRNHFNLPCSTQNRNPSKIVSTKSLQFLDHIRRICGKTAHGMHGKGKDYMRMSMLRTGLSHHADFLSTESHSSQTRAVEKQSIQTHHLFASLFCISTFPLLYLLPTVSRSPLHRGGFLARIHLHTAITHVPESSVSDAAEEWYQLTRTI